MDAEDRLVYQEQLMTAAQSDYAIAQVELKRQLGMLVVSEAQGARRVPRVRQSGKPSSPMSSKLRRLTKPRRGSLSLGKRHRHCSPCPQYLGRSL